MMAGRNQETMPAGLPATDPDDALGLVFADRKLGSASKLAFLILWRFAGRRPGSVTITADWLAGQCGRSPRAAWDLLAELQKNDLIGVGQRNRRRGSVEIIVYNPAPGSAANPAEDRQQRLEFSHESHQPSDPAGVSATAPGGDSKTPEGGEVAGVCARKPPRPLIKEYKEDLSYQSHKEAFSKNSKNSKNSTYSKDLLDAKPIGADAREASAAVLTAAGAEPAQKARLKARILAACGAAEPIAEWVAGAAANLVIYHGVPYQELAAILGDLVAMREAGKLRDAAAFVHAQARKLAGRHGAPWPRSAVEGAAK